MSYQIIKQGDEKLNLAVTLTMAEIKIMHNACVDVLKTLPEYPITAYKFAMQELEEIIIYQENKLNPHE
jgi:hypothetical protein